MSAALSFRNMTRSDLPAVTAIEAASFSRPWSRQQFLEALRDPSTDARVSVDGDQVAAFFILARSGQEARLLNLAVHPRRRRQGAGSACLAEVERLARGRDAARITLEVEETNLPAQLLYRKCGYRATRVLRQHYPDTGEDAYRMTKELAVVQENRRARP